jgi:hypothetical protein
VKRTGKIPRKNRAMRSGALQAFERQHPVKDITLRVGSSVVRIKLQGLEVKAR